MDKKINTNILYLCLHNLLKRRYGVDQEITKKELFCELGKHFLVPKKVKPLIIKEMEVLNLLKQQKGGTILILKNDFDLENDACKFFEYYGIY